MFILKAALPEYGNYDILYLSFGDWMESIYVPNKRIWGEPEILCYDDHVKKPVVT